MEGVDEESKKLPMPALTSLLPGRGREERCDSSANDSKGSACAGAVADDAAPADGDAPVCDAGDEVDSEEAAGGKTTRSAAKPLPLDVSIASCATASDANWLAPEVEPADTSTAARSKRIRNKHGRRYNYINGSNLLLGQWLLL